MYRCNWCPIEGSTNDSNSINGFHGNLHIFTLKGKEKEFYSAIARSPDGFFFLWVYIIGAPEEEKKFTYTITLTNTDKVIISLYILSTITDAYL